MSRIKVIIGVKVKGYCQAVPIEVEAYCSMCMAWKRNDPIVTSLLSHDGVLTSTPSKRGQCHRNPKTVNKHEDSWCMFFVPEKPHHGD